MSMHDVFEAIRAERAAQDAKFGPDNPLIRDEDPVKLAVLTEEVGEVARAILEDRPDDLKRELVQVAAVAVAWLEVLDAQAVHASTVAQLKTVCHQCLQEVSAVDQDHRCCTCAAAPAMEVTSACMEDEGCDRPGCPFCGGPCEPGEED